MTPRNRSRVSKGPVVNRTNKCISTCPYTHIDKISHIKSLDCESESCVQKLLTIRHTLGHVLLHLLLMGGFRGTPVSVKILCFALKCKVHFAPLPMKRKIYGNFIHSGLSWIQRLNRYKYEQVKSVPLTSIVTFPISLVTLAPSWVLHLPPLCYLSRYFKDGYFIYL